MTYRDDLFAAISRADALSQELDEMRRLLRKGEETVERTEALNLRIETLETSLEYERDLTKKLQAENKALKQINDCVDRIDTLNLRIRGLEGSLESERKFTKILQDEIKVLEEKRPVTAKGKRVFVMNHEIGACGTCCWREDPEMCKRCATERYFDLYGAGGVLHEIDPKTGKQKRDGVRVKGHPLSVTVWDRPKNRR